MSSTDEKTVEGDRASAFSQYFFAPCRPPCSVRVGAATDVGKVRKNNEDHYVVVRRSRGREIVSTNLSALPSSYPLEYAYTLIVADGVGGSAFGEFASQLALETALELAGNATSWVMKLTNLDAQQIQARIDAYAEQIQATLRGYIEAYPHLQGMATTWTSAYIVSGRAIVAHVGDSRAYLFRRGALQQITRDDTLAQQLVDAGVSEEAVQRFRNVLTNSFGGNAERVTMNIYPCELQPGDRLLLCTDGLSDMVSDTEISGVLQRDSDPQSACDRLVQLALNGGGKDNITVILCDLAETKISQEPSETTR
ncbi:MAG: PP2C family protein-serine/threonine phosphatase [Pirellulaceae bacterium]